MAVRISGTKKNIRWQKMAHNCYYVYQNGTGVTELDNEILPVGFSGTGLSVKCGKNTQTEEEKQTECENSNGMVWHNNQCITQAQHNCITSPGTWTGSACQCNPGYVLNGNKCVAMTAQQKCEKDGNKWWNNRCLTSDKYAVASLCTSGANIGEYIESENKCHCPTDTKWDETQGCVALTAQQKCEKNGNKWWNNRCLTSDKYAVASLCTSGANIGGYSESENKCHCPTDTKWDETQGCVALTEQEKCEKDGYTWFEDDCYGDDDYAEAQLCDETGGEYSKSAGWCYCGDDKDWNDTIGCFLKCGAGKYYNTTNVCAQCPEGYRDNPDTAASIDDCAMNIPEGHYLANVNDTTYTKCPADHWCGSLYLYYGSRDVFAEVATECPDHSSSSEGASECTCDTGYETIDGMTGESLSTTEYYDCTLKTYNCLAGQYLNVTTCAECPAGSYCPGGDFTYNGSVQGKNACPANSTSDAGAARCECDEGLSTAMGSNVTTGDACISHDNCSGEKIQKITCKNTWHTNYQSTGISGSVLEYCDGQQSCAEVGGYWNPTYSFCSCQKL